MHFILEWTYFCIIHSHVVQLMTKCCDPISADTILPFGHRSSRMYAGCHESDQFIFSEFFHAIFCNQLSLGQLFSFRLSLFISRYDQRTTVFRFARVERHFVFPVPENILHYFEKEILLSYSACLHNFNCRTIQQKS